MRRAIITIVDDDEVEMWTVLALPGGAALHPLAPSTDVREFPEQTAALVELSDHLYELLKDPS